jgi:hypothetical protein
MIFNLSQYAAVTTLRDLFVATNNITTSWFVYLVLILVFIIYFFLFKSYDTKAVLFAASFTCTIIASLLFLAQMCTSVVVIACIVVMVGSIINFMWSD